MNILMSNSESQKKKRNKPTKYYAKVNHKFSDSNVILTIFVSKLCTFSLSIANEQLSLRSCVFVDPPNLPLLDSLKILKVHLVALWVDFKIIRLGWTSKSYAYGRFNHTKIKEARYRMLEFQAIPSTIH